jgi:hypothetical protein
LLWLSLGNDKGRSCHVAQGASEGLFVSS